MAEEVEIPLNMEGTTGKEKQTNYVEQVPLHIEKEGRKAGERKGSLGKENDEKLTPEEKEKNPTTGEQKGNSHTRNNTNPDEQKSAKVNKEFAQRLFGTH